MRLAEVQDDRHAHAVRLTGRLEDLGPECPVGRQGAEGAGAGDGGAAGFGRRGRHGVGLRDVKRPMAAPDGTAGAKHPQTASPEVCTVTLVRVPSAAVTVMPAEGSACDVIVRGRDRHPWTDRRGPGLGRSLGVSGDSRAIVARLSAMVRPART